MADISNDKELVEFIGSVARRQAEAALRGEGVTDITPEKIAKRAETIAESIRQDDRQLETLKDILYRQSLAETAWRTAELIRRSRGQTPLDPPSFGKR